MFDFGKANDAQKEAIMAVEGPVLITAGSDTGKTFTLVQRTVYMIQEKNVKPEQIMIATFIEKAAKELITRITNELLDRKLAVNINKMYIGTLVIMQYSVDAMRTTKSQNFVRKDADLFIITWKKRSPVN